MIHPAQPDIAESLALQAQLLSRLQKAHKAAKKSGSSGRFPWGDLAAINEINRRLSEALGFAHGTEGTAILQELKGAKV